MDTQRGSLRGKAHKARLKMTPNGRRQLLLERGAAFSKNRTPGLKHVDRHTIVDSDGLSIHTYMVGHAENATATVVFIHGFTLAAEVYYMQVDYLQTFYPNIKSVLIDARGHAPPARSAQSSAPSKEQRTMFSQPSTNTHRPARSFWLGIPSADSRHLTWLNGQITHFGRGSSAWF